VLMIVLPHYVPNIVPLITGGGHGRQGGLEDAPNSLLIIVDAEYGMKGHGSGFPPRRGITSEVVIRPT
jgi:hypothetical protein